MIEKIHFGYQISWQVFEEICDATRRQSRPFCLRYVGSAYKNALKRELLKIDQRQGTFQVSLKTTVESQALKTAWQSHLIQRLLEFVTER